MITKEKIRFFAPDCLIAASGLLCGLAYRLYMNMKGYKKCKIREKKLFVLGTGPSFKQTIEKYEKILSSNPCAVVNGFATNLIYEKIQPKYYCLADPAYFTPYHELSERNKGVVDILRNSLLNKTSWPITFIFPASGRGSELQIALEQIKGADFLYYNNKGNAVVMPDAPLKFICWNMQIVAPLCQTVLNTILNIAIASKVKDIYLVGADTSWIKTYEIDQTDNTLYSKDEHFYGVNRIPIYKDEINKIKQELHSELMLVSKALKAYWTLDAFAKFNNVHLYNASEYSWIDALERYSLSKFPINKEHD